MQRSDIRILVVDDDKALCQALAKRLGNAGFQTQSVSNGVDALLACAPTPPDIVLLDVSMPTIDGFTVCERIRSSIDHPVVIVFLTGATSLTDSQNLEQHVTEAGGDYFLYKPYDSALLIEMIEQIAGSDLVRSPVES